MRDMVRMPVVVTRSPRAAMRMNDDGCERSVTGLGRHTLVSFCKLHAVSVFICYSSHMTSFGSFVRSTQRRNPIWDALLHGALWIGRRL